LARLYNTPGPENTPISKYAWGSADYHDTLRSALELVVADLTALFGAFDYRVCVDTAPLLERSLARRSGLGWIGKNTCLINQMQGSYLFLGEILTALEFPPDTPAPDRCGSCRRCLDSCPTQALVPDPHRPGRIRLDARLCISTWTIEQKGELADAQKEASGAHLFGCDICQSVCPWNRKAPHTAEPGFQPLETGSDPGALAHLTAEEFRQRFRRTPLWRSKHSGLLRNVATVLGNTRDLRYLPHLQHLAQHEAPEVRAHAQWALTRLSQGPKVLY